jgi:hypothetical protein
MKSLHLPACQDPHAMGDQSTCELCRHNARCTNPRNAYFIPRPKKKARPKRLADRQPLLFDSFLIV